MSCLLQEKRQEKIQAERFITYFASFASSSPQINATMAPVQITHTLAIVHHPQIHPAQPGFVQWTLPSSVAGSSGRRRCIPCFDAGIEERMYECPGRNSRANCQFSLVIISFYFQCIYSNSPIK